MSSVENEIFECKEVSEPDQTEVVLTTTGTLTSEGKHLEKEDNPTETKTSYSESEYWNKRYKNTKTMFDWYLDIERLTPLLNMYAAKPDPLSSESGPSVLNLGYTSSSSSSSLLSLS